MKKRYFLIALCVSTFVSCVGSDFDKEGKAQSLRETIQQLEAELKNPDIENNENAKKRIQQKLDRAKEELKQLSGVNIPTQRISITVPEESMKLLLLQSIENQIKCAIEQFDLTKITEKNIEQIYKKSRNLLFLNVSEIFNSNKINDLLNELVKETSENLEIAECLKKIQTSILNNFLSNRSGTQLIKQLQHDFTQLSIVYDTTKEKTTRAKNCYKKLINNWEEAESQIKNHPHLKIEECFERYHETRNKKISQYENDAKNFEKGILSILTNQKFSIKEKYTSYLNFLNNNNDQYTSDIKELFCGKTSQKEVTRIFQCSNTDFLINFVLSPFLNDKTKRDFPGLMKSDGVNGNEQLEIYFKVIFQNTTAVFNSLQTKNIRARFDDLYKKFIEQDPESASTVDLIVGYTVLGHSNEIIPDFIAEKGISSTCINHIILPHVYNILKNKAYSQNNATDHLFQNALFVVACCGTPDQANSIYKLLKKLPSKKYQLPEELFLKNVTTPAQRFCPNNIFLHSIGDLQQIHLGEKKVNFLEKLNNLQNIIGYLQFQPIRDIFEINIPESEMKKIPELAEFLTNNSTDDNIDSLNNIIQRDKNTETTSAKISKFSQELWSAVLNTAGNDGFDLIKQELMKVVSRFIPNPNMKDDQQSIDLESALEGNWLNPDERAALHNEQQKLTKNNKEAVLKNVLNMENKNDSWITNIAKKVIPVLAR